MAKHPLNLIRVMPAKGQERRLTEYLHCTWTHDFPDDPVEIFYEITPDRGVPRMVECFADGRQISNTLEWDIKLHGGHATSLVHGDMPNLAEIEHLIEHQTEFHQAQSRRTNLNRCSRQQHR